MTYWFLLAAALGPCAAGAVAVGARLVREGRRTPNQALQPTPGA